MEPICLHRYSLLVNAQRVNNNSFRTAKRLTMNMPINRMNIFVPVHTRHLIKTNIM